MGMCWIRKCNKAEHNHIVIIWSRLPYFLLGTKHVLYVNTTKLNTTICNDMILFTQLPSRHHICWIRKYKKAEHIRYTTIWHEKLPFFSRFLRGNLGRIVRCKKNESTFELVMEAEFFFHPDSRAWNKFYHGKSLVFLSGRNHFRRERNSFV